MGGYDGVQCCRIVRWMQQSMVFAVQISNSLYLIFFYLLAKATRDLHITSFFHYFDFLPIILITVSMLIDFII